MSSAFSFSTADLRRPTTNRLASSRLSDNFFDIYSLNINFAEMEKRAWKSINTEFWVYLRSRLEIVKSAHKGE